MFTYQWLFLHQPCLFKSPVRSRDCTSNLNIKTQKRIQKTMLPTLLKANCSLWGLRWRRIMSHFAPNWRRRREEVWGSRWEKGRLTAQLWRIQKTMNSRQGSKGSSFLQASLLSWIFPKPHRIIELGEVPRGAMCWRILISQGYLGITLFVSRFNIHKTRSVWGKILLFFPAVLTLLTNILADIWHYLKENGHECPSTNIMNFNFISLGVSVVPTTCFNIPVLFPFILQIGA